MSLNRVSNYCLLGLFGMNIGYAMGNALVGAFWPMAFNLIVAIGLACVLFMMEDW